MHNALTVYCIEQSRFLNIMHTTTAHSHSGLAPALDAPLAEFTDRLGQRLAYYADTRVEGRPLVLIHSINAAPSSFEVRPLFEHYRTHRPVYSLDLPGFGHSARPRGPYSAERFASAIEAFLSEVVGEAGDVVALSLSSEFAARAVLAQPQRVASLVLISPTGLSTRPLPAPRTAQRLHSVLTAPGLGGALYALVSSRPSIRYYLGKSFAGKPLAEVIEYAHATSHQPGARHAPLVFLSTQLFTPDALNQLYAPLREHPVMVIADTDPYVTFDALPGLLESHPNWSHQRLAPHRGLPQWERLDALIQSLDAFWST